MDESDGVKREMREVVAEKKGELKVRAIFQCLALELW